ncbi:MAG: TolC family protein [Bacteroidota bacterium]
MRQITLLSLLLLFLAACGVQKRSFDVQPSRIEIQEDYLSVSEDSLFDSAQPVVEWWQQFNDPVLDTLIARGRTNNLTVNTAVANLFAARAALKGTKLDRLPTVTANGSYQRQRLGQNLFITEGNPTFDQYNTSLDATWESNLFGRVSNRVRAAYASQQAAQEEMKAAYTSIFSEIARNYLELRGTQYQLNIAQRNLKDQQHTYDLVNEIYTAGTGNSLDVARALAQLDNTKATIPPLLARTEALKNSLSVLIGELPGSLDLAVVDPKPLPDLPATVLVGNGVDLLRRRPDVQQAEQELTQHIAQYNLSVAELYPSVRFGGSIGFSAINFSKLGQGESFSWNILPSINWAAFNLGRVKRQIDQQDALTLAALNRYEQTVLQALEEIKTAMSNYSNELERREILRQSSQSSAEAVQLAQKRYQAGLDNFIDYLNADRTLLEAENELAISETTSATYLVGIYKALGGGWEHISDEEVKHKYERLKLADGSLR